MLRRWAVFGIAILGAFVFPGLPTLAKEKMVSENLVPNGSFETLDENGIPAPFRFGIYQGKAEVTVDSSVARNGKNSVKITGSGADRGLVGIRLPVQGGKTYRATFWYKATSTVAPGEVVVRLMAYKTSGDAESDKVKWNLDWLVDPYEGEYQVSGNNFHILNWQQGGDEWQKLTVAFRLPQDVIALALEGFNWLGNGTVWFDDISLVEVALE